MREYSDGLGADSTHKGGETQPRPKGDQGTNYGGQGAVSAVVGSGSPVIVATGAENNGGKKRGG